MKTKSFAPIAAALLCVMSAAGSSPAAPAAESTPNALALTAKLPSLTQQGDSFILQPKPAAGPVVNPGKGWILYNFHI